MKPLLLFYILLIITLTSSTPINILFNTDYFFHSEEGNVKFYNKTAQASLKRSIINLFIVSPVVLWGTGPILTFAPIGLGIFNAYLYFGSLQEIKRIDGGLNHLKNNKKRKTKINYKRYYKSKIGIIKKVQKINQKQRKFTKFLGIGAGITFLGLFFSYLNGSQFFFSFFIFSFISFSFITSFYITLFNEQNNEFLERSYLFDEYNFECLDGHDSNFEAFLDSFHSNVKLSFGYTRGNYLTIDNVKVNRKCITLVKQISEIKISIFNVLVKMFLGGIITIYKTIFDTFNLLQAFIFILSIGIFCKMGLFKRFVIHIK